MKRLLPLLLSGGTVVLAVVTAVVASLTSPSDSSSLPMGPSSTAVWARAALAAWSGFLVDARPRPLVLSGPAVLDPSSGFADNAAKLSYIGGAIDPPGQWPPRPPSAGGYPLRSAQDSFKVLSSASKGPTATGRLSVVRVSLGTAVFDTDRGPLRLPAWNFGLSGVRDPASVLAVGPERIYQPRIRSGLVSLLSASRLDDRRLSLTFVGFAAGTGPCTADYNAESASTSTAVAVRLVEHFHANPLALACSLVGYQRHATLELDSPLGARVLVDSRNGVAIPVVGS